MGTLELGMEMGMGTLELGMGTLAGCGERGETVLLRLLCRVQ